VFTLPTLTARENIDSLRLGVLDAPHYTRLGTIHELGGSVPASTAATTKASSSTSASGRKTVFRR